MDLEIREGKPRFDAVVNSAASRVRPVLMGALTTVLGVIPLFTDAFFKSMAVVLVFGTDICNLADADCRAGAVCRFLQDTRNGTRSRSHIYSMNKAG